MTTPKIVMVIEVRNGATICAIFSERSQSISSPAFSSGSICMCMLGARDTFRGSEDALFDIAEGLPIRRPLPGSRVGEGATVSD